MTQIELRTCILEFKVAPRSQAPNPNPKAKGMSLLGFVSVAVGKKVFHRSEVDLVSLCGACLVFG